jgi:hypothetical protein
VALRTGALDRARQAFTQALGTRGGDRDYDALTGLGMTAFRQEDLAGARRAFEQAARDHPTDSLIQSYLTKLPAPIQPVRLPPPRRSATLRVDARTGWRRFETPGPEGTGWQPFWIKGVNIGAALPGKHPSEFPPDDGTYERWLELVASMNANTVRVYTIHPPHFYRALEQWNRAHPGAPLWLIHGVWTELPPGRLEERYDDPRWRAAFRAEARRVVDLLHGRAAIDPRPGHASGVYRSDVSRWVLAYITGREWEPYSVVEYSRLHPDRTSYRGRFVETVAGNPAEVWLAAESDELLRYEVATYNTIRPIAYTNWPTLDPLTHPTESTQEEEARLRPWTLPEPSKEYDNDAIGLDATRMRATAANPAGTFASYHAYPYYPDFMVLDPEYARARSPEGPSHYFGYLMELIRHHGEMPVVISEYGVPSSRGNAHAQPQGWHHGGHSEAEQAAIDARLTREIHAAGSAGAVLFALIDEWFKKNWAVIDFEQPLERNRLWLNALDAEQHYGILAMRAGPKDSTIVIDGQPNDWGTRGATWAASQPGVEGHRAASADDPLTLRDLRVTSDEASLYLRLDVGAIDWSRGRYLIGIDSYRPDLGARRLPRTGTACPTGLEFVVDLVGPVGSELLVDRPYNLYRTVVVGGSPLVPTVQAFNRPWMSAGHGRPQWDSLLFESNRARVGRDGTIYPAVVSPRNQLRFARQTDHSLADWYADPVTKVIEIRLGWGMLQVMDPSSHWVLHGTGPDGRSPAGVKTDGFRLVVQSYDPAGNRPGTTLGCGPGPAPFHYTWAGWEAPRWHQELKPVFATMRETFRGISGPLSLGPAADRVGDRRGER